MLKALRQPSICLLWIGQATSAIGDEIYRVALVWLAVGLVGANAGYLAAGQSGMLLLFSLIGGKWSDRWEHFRTLLWVDALRAGIVILPVLIPASLSAQHSQFHLIMIWSVALALAALSAFFDPVVHSLLPRLSQGPEMLQAATGLMSTTFRLARAVGPSIIGLLSSFIPMMQFFSLDAASFLVSFLCISLLRRQIHEPRIREESAAVGFRETLVSGYRIIRRSEGMRYMMLAKAIAGGSWNLAYGLGLVLFVRKMAPGDMKAFSLVLGTYGIGNIAAALILGNLPRVRLTFLVYSGYLVMGLGFLLVALSPSIPWLLAATAFTAIGGPLNDLPFVDIVQSRYPVKDIPKIFRLRMALETGTTLIGMLLAPTLFVWLSARSVVAICGLVTFVVGAGGLLPMKKIPFRKSFS